VEVEVELCKGQNALDAMKAKYGKQIDRVELDRAIELLLRIKDGKWDLHHTESSAIICQGCILNISNKHRDTKMNELMSTTKQETVTVEHAFSGKELVIVNSPAVIQEYFEMGYVVVAS
jgi:hypothetical protein